MKKMTEINTLMKIAQKESAAAQSKIDTSVTTQNQADVALDTLKIHFSIHHGNHFHRPQSSLHIYKMIPSFLSSAFRPRSYQ